MWVHVDNSNGEVLGILNFNPKGVVSPETLEEYIDIPRDVCCKLEEFRAYGSVKYDKNSNKFLVSYLARSKRSSDIRKVLSSLNTVMVGGKEVDISNDSINILTAYIVAGVYPIHWKCPKNHGFISISDEIKAKKILTRMLKKLNKLFEDQKSQLKGLSDFEGHSEWFDSVVLAKDGKTHAPGFIPLPEDDEGDMPDGV